MSKVLAVAARELRERWLLFPAGLVFGFTPLVLPPFGVEREDVPFVALMGAVLLGVSAAVVIGSTMLARDAANGRLGFLFSRPVSWPAIWGGKWLAAIVLVAGTAVLAAIPFTAASRAARSGGSLPATADGPGWALFLTMLVVGVGIANFNATAYRSRSAWLVVDLVLVVAGLWATREYVADLWRYGILGHDDWGVAIGLLPLCLALLAASAAQTAIGRTDVRRAHHAMSVVFWAVVGLTLAAAAGYLEWIRSAGPAELGVHTLARDPSGRWIYVEGASSRGGGWYGCGRLVDTVSGRWVARPEPDHEWEATPQGVLFSADGRFGVVPDSDGRGAAVVLFDLTADPPRASHVSLESSPPPSWKASFAVSPSADTVFMAHESGASIFALPSGRRMATTTIPPGWRPAATRFVGEGAARAWLVPWDAASDTPPPRAEVRVVDLATDGRAAASVFPIATPFDRPFRAWGALLPDAEGQRLITVDAGVHLRDGATGALLATLANPGGDVATSFLSDGRVVAGEYRLAGVETLPPGTTLRVFHRDGAKLVEVPLDLPPPGVSVGPEVAPGRILVASHRSSYLSTDTLVVDVAAGRVVERLSGLRPAAGFLWGPAVSAARVDKGSVQFFRDQAGRVVRVDFASGERTTVTGTGAPRGTRIRIGW